MYRYIFTKNSDQPILSTRLQPLRPRARPTISDISRMHVSPNDKARAQTARGEFIHRYREDQNYTQFSFSTYMLQYVRVRVCIYIYISRVIHITTEFALRVSYDRWRYYTTTVPFFLLLRFYIYTTCAIYTHTRMHTRHEKRIVAFEVEHSSSAFIIYVYICII